MGWVIFEAVVPSFGAVYFFEKVLWSSSLSVTVCELRESKRKGVLVASADCASFLLSILLGRKPLNRGARKACAS